MKEIRKRNVAVIGGAGFLGSHLVDYLVEERECKVLVLDNLISGRKDFIHPKAEFLWCDITHSENALVKIFKTYAIEYVFNYAAEPYIPVSYERPLHVFDINARGALMALNAAHDAGIERFLQVSSAEIYGDVTGKINEDSPARPHSTYGASKLAIDTLIQARRKESEVDAIALRQFNCVGERDILHPYVIPEIVTQIQKTNIVRLGNNTERDFMYARDAVISAVELLELGRLGEVYNLGSEDCIKIYDLAKLIGRIMGKDVAIYPDINRFRPWDIEHLQSDNTKIYKVIEHRPTVTLQEALELTIRDLSKYV